MSPLFQAHSGIRFLVLLVGVVAVILCALGEVQKKEFGKAARIACSAFVGMMHLQVLVGIAVAVTGPWYGALYGHVALMAGATLLAQVTVSRNRRLPKPGHRLPLIGVGGALLMIVIGISAIGRSPLGMTAMQRPVG